MIWNFTRYREYLESRLGAHGSRTGLRKKLAEAIPVHTTFVSQVMNGSADFSLEQGESINSFLDHTVDEGEYFLLLIMKDRAGSKSLASRFEQKIQELRRERLHIGKRLKVRSKLSNQDKEKFYSSYIYGAIHVLTGLEAFRTVDALATATRLSRSRISEAVEFLLGIGVLKQTENGELIPGSQHMHLDNGSELVLRHHTNWRFHAITNLQFQDRDDLHYSACLTLSRADVFKVKESILQNLKSNVEIISNSEEEVPYVLSFDFYKLLS